MTHSDCLSDHASTTIKAGAAFSAVTLTSFLFSAKPQCKGLLDFVDSCRRYSERTTRTDAGTSSGREWRQKCEAGTLTDEELRTGLADAFEVVIHRFLSDSRPGYHFAVRIKPDRLWSASGPKIQVESFGPEVDHSIMEDLRSLVSLSRNLNNVGLEA